MHKHDRRHVVDRVFDESLQNASMPVPSRVWSGIASELEKDDLRRKVFWYRSLAVASLALLMGLGTWVLAYQADKAAGPVASGKALRAWDLAWGERPCRPTRATFAGAAKQATPGVSNAVAAQLGRGTLGSKRHIASQLTWNTTEPASDIRQGNPAVPQIGNPEALKEGLQKAPENLDALHRMVRSRKANFLPALSDLGRRPSPGIQWQEEGLLASLETPKATEKRREKEFAYVLEGDEPTTKPQKHWELGAGFAPDITFASTTPIEQQVSRGARIIANNPTQANTNRLSPVMAYASTLRASFEFNDRVSVRSGLTCSNRETSATEAVSAYGKTAAYQSTLNLTSMEVPVSVRYNVVKNKNFDYYVTSGVSGTFLLHYSNTQVTSAGQVAARRNSEMTDVMRPSQASVLVSTGLRYRIFDRVNLQVEPGLRYGVFTNEYAFSQSRPMSMSLLTGINYHF